MDNIISYVESEIMCELQAYMSERGSMTSFEAKTKKRMNYNILCVI